MELTAVIEGLKSLKRRCTVIICTDSQYVKNGMENWIHGWKRNGWKTAAKQPVKNDDLWKELDALVGRHQVSWTWVKGTRDTRKTNAPTIWQTVARRSFPDCRTDKNTV